jgi:subtilase family serine protease
LFASISALIMLALFGHGHHVVKPIDNFGAHSPFRVHHYSSTGPTGYNPTQIKTAYGLPSDGGAGKTIAIIDAYNSNTAANDLNTFSTNFNLPSCTVQNGCFSQVEVSPRTPSNSGWALEESLDIEWAHAIAPQAKIMLVEARSASGTNLLAAVNYARNLSSVNAVSMSWGGAEFSGESSYDSYFTSNHGVNFFASAGDSGSGVDWPAVSTNVIGVGGTTLNLASNGSVTSETAWSGSGGGVSAYVTEPSYQTALVSDPSAHRASPDVSYDADPATGFAVYDSTRYDGEAGWFQVGGTSAGAPQWAAISALGNGVTLTKLYQDAAGPNYLSDLRDIVSGSNGACGAICTASPGYDFITGLGSPLTTNF